MCDDDYHGSFSIPLGSTAFESLDLALARLHELTNKALLHLTDGDGEMYSLLATASLEKKINSCYPDGFSKDEDDSDRIVWTAIMELEQIRKRATSDNAHNLASEWLSSDGSVKDDFMPELSKAPDPLKTDLIFAEVLAKLCEYVEGWTDAITEE